jgi:hypothetical protein
LEVDKGLRLVTCNAASISIDIFFVISNTTNGIWSPFMFVSLAFRVGEVASWFVWIAFQVYWILPDHCFQVSSKIKVNFWLFRGTILSIFRETKAFFTGWRKRITDQKLALDDNVPE